MNWKERAQQARGEGYRPGNGWERQLEQHLRKFFPQLVRELGANLKPFLEAQTWDVMVYEQDLVEQNTPPFSARELALARLLPPPPEDLERPQTWEVQSGLESQAEAAAEVLPLLGKPRSRNPPRS